MMSGLENYKENEQKTSVNQAKEAVSITTVKVDKYLLKYGKVKLQMIRKPVKACY